MPQPAKTLAGPTKDAPAIAIARLGAVVGESGEVSAWVYVHFNPSSLQLQVSNELKDTKNHERKQYVAKSNAKLTMELQFDTSHNGDDVTQTTRRLQAFISPPLPADERARQFLPPPIVLFEWGRVKFQGVAESYKETIDFFSADGVPLRASVTLTLSRQDQVFDRSAGNSEPPNATGDKGRRDTPPGSPAGVATAAGAPNAARSVAAANGQENLRFGNGDPLTIGTSITLKPPVAFAAGGGAGLGLSAGIGVSAGIGAGAGAAAEISIGASAGVSAGASAGVSGLAKLSATEGAFAALRVTTTAGPSEARLNTTRLLPAVRSSTLSTDRNASFQVGGKATLEGPAGLRADVGAGGGLRGKLTFEDS